VYGHALAKHVWRSTYIVQNNELDKTLEALAYEDPLHEAYLRAVLLKVLPERQSRCKDACVKKAVADLELPLEAQSHSLQKNFWKI